MLFSLPPQNIFLQPRFYAILVPTIPLAPQIQWGFPVDTVCNTNLLTYFLACLIKDALELFNSSPFNGSELSSLAKLQTPTSFFCKFLDCA